MILETERLYLREMNQSDFDLFMQHLTGRGYHVCI